MKTLKRALCWALGHRMLCVFEEDEDTFLRIHCGRCGATLTIWGWM